MEGPVVLRQPDLHQRRGRVTLTHPSNEWFGVAITINRCLTFTIPFGRRPICSHVAKIDRFSVSTGLIPRCDPHPRGEGHHIILDHHRGEHARRSAATPASRHRAVSGHIEMKSRPSFRNVTAVLPHPNYVMRYRYEQAHDQRDRDLGRPSAAMGR